MDRNLSVLVVAAEEVLVSQIVTDLRKSGYDVAIANSFPEGLRVMEGLSPTLVLVDRLVGAFSGLQVCRELRNGGYRGVLLILMTHDTVEDRTACLEAGVDDYLLKPYRSEAFLQRVHLYLQPSTGQLGHLHFGDLVLDLETRQAKRGDRTIDLTMKEFELLRFMMEHPREVLSREQILENVWGYDFVGESNVIEVYVRYLRLKIEGDGEKRLIQTVRGVGYVLRDG